MKGIIAAVPTPINSSHAPNLKLYIEHCSWALKNGCDGLNILGSTGEASSFDFSTRKQIMESAITNLDPKKLMVGTGTTSLSETVKLTQYADELQYQIALVLPPYYYKPITNEGLFSWYKELHYKLKERKIKIFFYNFPQLTGLEIPIEVIKKLHCKWPNRFSGVKDSSGNLAYCRYLASKLPKLSVFPSSETSLNEAKTSNFSGCISATANQTGLLCQEIWKNKSTEKIGTLEKILFIRETIASENLIPSIKYLIAKRTGESSWEQLVPPFNTISEKRKSALDKLFKDDLSKRF